MTRFPIRLKTRLLFVATLAVVPALAAIVFLQMSERRRVREQTIAENLRIVRSVAAQQGEVFDDARALLVRIGEHEAIEQGESAGCLELLATLLRAHPSYFNLAIADRDGTILCSGAPGDARRSAAVALGRSWYRRAVLSGTTTLSGVQVTEEIGRPVILVAYPLPANAHRPARVAAAAVPLDHITRILDSEIVPGATLTLFDRSLMIVGRYPEPERWVGKRLPNERLRTHLASGAREDVDESAGIDGVDRLYVTVPLASSVDSGLYLGLGIAHDLAFAEADRLLRQYVWLFAIVLLGTAGAAIIGGHWFVVMPVRSLRAVTDRLAGGDLSTRAQLVKGVAGMSELGDALNTMAAALDRRERERDRAEQELRESQDRYRMLFDVNPHPMWVYDVETLKFLEVNDAAIRRYGYTRDEFRSMRITEIRPAEDVPRLMATISIANGWSHAGTWRHRLKSGHLIDVEVVSHTLTFDGRPAELVTAEDVTDRRRAERKVRLLARALESTNEMVSVTGPDDRLIFVNRAFLDTYGYSWDEVIGRTPAFLHADGAELLDEIVRESRDRGWHGELLNKRKDGSTLTIALSTSAILDGDGSLIGLLGVARDITDRIKAARALREAEERMRFALEASRIGVWELNLKTREVHVSDICRDMLGLPADVTTGSMDQFVQRIHPEDREHALQVVDRSVREHTDAELEYRVVTEGGVVRRISSFGRFSYDVDGTPLRGAGVTIDVTERCSLEDQLRQAQKMEAVGQLAGGIAHDFNNLLTAIQGYAELVSDTLPEEDDRRASVEEIRRAADRATNLTRQLLAFSRKQILTLRPLHLGDVVSEITPMLRRLLGETVDLKTIAGDAGRVKADAAQIEQVLLNLAVNARDAMPDGGRLTIETSDIWLDDAYARRHPTMRPGPHVLLTVSDSGVGMDAEAQKHAFEPFFTTKPKGQGTGLGLATVYGIVKQSGGHIWVYSEVGVGTTFKVFLPRTDEVAAAAHTPEHQRPALPGDETILLVEDEQVVREYASTVLSRLGYAVHAVADPGRAIEYARSYAGPIHVVLTDVVLPGMSGPAMAAELRDSHPESKVLYMSGYTDNAIVRHGVLDGDVFFLQKPFSGEALARRVRELLDASIADCGMRIAD